MLAYSIRRIFQLIPVLFVISLLVFLMMHIIPGDPVKNMLGLEASKEAIEAERERLGLNDPLPTQYFRFISGAMKGDLGKSIFTKKPITQEILQRYPYTVKLAIGGTLFATVVGVLIGITCAVRRGTVTDSSLVVVSLVAVSTPSFFLALMMMLIFALNLHWLPSIG
ncbi:MAG: ABC transporter permease, partial [Synergistales bacterium]|nr:ABC transporter permease [Synergistales bacterium]